MSSSTTKVQGRSRSLIIARVATEQYKFFTVTVEESGVPTPTVVTGNCLHCC